MTTQTAESPGSSATWRTSAALASGEFLAFKLGAEEYGIDIQRVQEIRSFEPPTRIADARAHVLGVLNLRGVIVPVVDLRVRFGVTPHAYDSVTAIIVLNLGSRVIGAVVDAVSDVIRLGGEQLRPMPEFNAGVAGDHLIAIGSLGTRMLILIDIDKLMSSPDMGLVVDTLH